MGLMKWLGLEPPESKNVTLGEVIDKFDIVDVVTGTDEHGPFVIVTEKGGAASIDYLGEAPWYASEDYIPPVVTKTETRQLKESPQYGEIGSSSPSPFTSFLRKEYNRELLGQQGLDKYNKMRSDGVVSGTLLLFKTPVNAARWFMEPATQEDLDKEIADFIWKCLTEYMSISWTQLKSEAMLMCEFGYYMFEKVWENRKIDGVTRTILKKLSPRHPMDVKEWHFDENGGPESVTIYVEDANGHTDEKSIKIRKLIVFTLNKEANNITGRSVLRSAYKHWYYKEQLYKIDAIQKERHGIGIPVIKLPPNFSDNDKIAANELGRNLRTNERAHVVLPPNWEVIFAKLEGQPVDAIKSIELHDKAIRENILAAFLSGETTTKEEDLSLFLKSSRFIADSICDAFNLYLIPELVDYNYPGAKYPKLKVRRIGEQADWRILTFAVRNLIGAGVIRPDDELEKAMREEMDLPIADVATVRIVQTPQANAAAPASVPNATPGVSTPESASPTASNNGKSTGSAGSTGLPRQTPLPGIGLPRGNAGFDKGGQS